MQLAWRPRKSENKRQKQLCWSNKVSGGEGKFIGLDCAHTDTELQIYCMVRCFTRNRQPSVYLLGYCIYYHRWLFSVLNACMYIYKLAYFQPDLCSQSVPAALGGLLVGSVCGEPQGEVSGCMLHAPLYSVRVTRQPLVWPAVYRPQWRLKIWCGRTIQAFPLKMWAMLFILARSFLQKERNGQVCSRSESYLKHVDVFRVFDTSTQPDDLLCQDIAML